MKSLRSYLFSYAMVAAMDVVVGFSVFRFQMCGNVMASYNSHTSIAPKKTRKMTLVQYHIKLFLSSIYYQVNGRDHSEDVGSIFSTIPFMFKSLSCKTQRLTAILNEQLPLFLH